jgi:hypothetical protein
VKGKQLIVKENAEKLCHCFRTIFQKQIWKQNIFHEGKQFAIYYSCQGNKHFPFLKSLLCSAISVIVIIVAIVILLLLVLHVLSYYYTGVLISP